MRLLYSLSSVLALVLFFISGLMPVMSNFAKPVNLAQALALAAQVRMLIALAHYLTYNRDMEIREYKVSALALRDSSRLAAVVLGMTACFVLIYGVLLDRTDLLAELGSAALLTLASAALYGIHRVESGIGYSRVENNTVVDENAVDAYFIRG